MTSTTTARPSRLAVGFASTALAAGLVLVAAPGAAYADSAPTPTPRGDGTTGCSTGTLPSTVQGAPKNLKAGAARGYWVWHDTAGWHLRVTHADKHKLVFTGTILTTSRQTDHRVRLERRDHISRSTDRLTTAFRFTNYGGIDGLDVKAGCSASVTFDLLVAGRHIDPAKVHLGRVDAHPTSALFDVSRVPRS